MNSIMQPRAGLPRLPIRMRALPLDARGYPVPWFVAWFDGKPDFRVMDGQKLKQAIKWRRCWVCGQPLGKWQTFVIGPMCAINRTIAEPPSHDECAEFSAKGCPFLTLPNAKRREATLPEGLKEPAGVGLKRNPGVVVLWTSDYKLQRVSAVPEHGIAEGILFRLGDPIRVRWIAEGREATRQEVLDSIESGLTSLRAVAEGEGEASLALFNQYVERAMRLVPA